MWNGLINPVTVCFLLFSSFRASLEMSIIVPELIRAQPRTAVCSRVPFFLLSRNAARFRNAPRFSHALNFSVFSACASAAGRYQL